eukprot:CAMPEP_0197837990 /NCGR_PEP_ID=MMETSP1437-20131217/33959_1 /TAXON_ID=49252 ORGANISM="Eucampia antarctica, Strain CCMP1452" /NCGR_SAMPLE_ID=MMETSP1437 /ASSEMBLY_ACC=CAM_ASM_001096 /LENGTH=929 /DNA_ID=CAMNT_0043445485 /DNA_START=185 /DNA_END=2974 /DNA_ORIENTATION=-
MKFVLISLLSLLLQGTNSHSVFGGVDKLISLVTPQQKHSLFGDSNSELKINNFSSKLNIRGGSLFLPVEQNEEESKIEDNVDNHTSVERSEASENEDISVTKRDGGWERLDRNKILKRIQSLSFGLNSPYLSVENIVDTIVMGTYPNVTTDEIDTLASETAASMSTKHPDYTRLAARIYASQIHKKTPDSFSEAVFSLYDEGNGFIDGKLAELVKRRSKDINEKIVHSRDMDLTYFGLKTLERSYLLKTEKGDVLERPQYMLMRVALGIHCCGENLSPEKEDTSLEAAFETYDLMSNGYFTHASPTLFHSGTIHPQLSSCFLVQMSEDSINGIYDTLKRCAVISKSAGGIGLSAHNIRARGTYIKGTRGVSNGLVPMLRVFDVTSRYVDQGGGKRPGAFAIYLEPWHADIFDVLNLKKNHGKEEQRARDLFYGLWVPDLFMKRVQEDGKWSLMCPNQSKGLAQCHGEEFEKLYEQYESEGKFVRQVRARELWRAILDAQIETGTPYLLYKDAANAKSNQKNLGTIQCSNLCTEIIQYTDEDEVAVCNLASICLSRFIVSSRGKYGSTNSVSEKAYFDHDALHRVTKIVTRNLNKIIDVNVYPVEGAKKSNHRHRPIGIGVSGLADAFLRLGLPFTSDQAKQLNEAIFETIYHAALESSAELAEEEGAYETFTGSPASEGKLQFDLWGCKDNETPSHVFHREDKDTENFCPQNYSDSLSNASGYDWDSLRSMIKKQGLRNSLLTAPMPTASTSQILGVNECFEPFVSNLYVRRVKAGEFIMANPHLLQDLSDRGLWNPTVRNQLMRDGGSVSNISCIPDSLKELYRTVWELKMKDVIDMAAARGKFIDQSQSLNLFVSDPTVDKLTAMHFYAWKKGLKTGMYYLRTRPAVNAIQYTVDDDDDDDEEDVNPNLLSDQLPVQDDDVCLSCSA